MNGTFLRRYFCETIICGLWNFIWQSGNMLFELSWKQFVRVTLAHFIEVIWLWVSCFAYCMASSRFLSTLCKSCVKWVGSVRINHAVTEILALNVSIVGSQKNTFNKPTWSQNMVYEVTCYGLLSLFPHVFAKTYALLWNSWLLPLGYNTPCF